MKQYTEKILINKEELQNICQKLGKEISKDYKGKKLLLVCVLKGAFVFTADLMREITIDCEVDFVIVNSYEGTQRRENNINIVKDLSVDLSDYHILIVEDILESGHTLNFVSNLIKNKNPLSTKICVLLNKPNCRQISIEADYVGKNIPNDFVVGYGLDYNQNLRNIPYIGVLKKEYYSHNC